MFKWSWKNTWRNKRPTHQTSLRCHHLQTFPRFFALKSWRTATFICTKLFQCAPKCFWNCFDTTMIMIMVMMRIEMKRYFASSPPMTLHCAENNSVISKCMKIWRWLWSSLYISTEWSRLCFTPPPVLKRDVEWGGGGWGGIRGRVEMFYKLSILSPVASADCIFPSENIHPPAKSRDAHVGETKAHQPPCVIQAGWAPVPSISLLSSPQSFFFFLSAPLPASPFTLFPSVSQMKNWRNIVLTISHDPK